MKLDVWLEQWSISDTDFAATVGSDRTTISRIRRGLNQPSWELAGKIKAATGGNVSADDFLPVTEAAE